MKVKYLKKAPAIAMILALIIVFSGCSFSFDSESLMSPPNSVGDEAAIHNLIATQAGNNYQLVYPSSGDNRNAINLEDLDKDEENESLVFYSKDDEIHALFIKKNNSSFSLIEDILLDCTSVDKCDFTDIDGDSIKEVLIGVNNGSTLNNLFAFRFTDSVSLINISASYTSYVTGDFNYDKCSDILTITLGESASASLYSFSGEEIAPVSSCSFDNDITKCSNIIFGQVDATNVGAAIDSINSSGEFTTQIIYYDKADEALSNPLYEYSGYSSTKRTLQIFSTDVENDNIIEVPICSLMDYSSDEDETTVPTQINWENYDTHEMEFALKRTVIYCTNDGYMFTIPSIWNNSVTARYDIKTKELKVYVWEYIDGSPKMTDELLTIKTFDTDSFDSDHGAYKEIIRNNSYVYAYTIPTTDNALLISGEDVENNFSLASYK